MHLITNDDGSQIKWCARCVTWKDPTEFHKNRVAKDGLAAYCKECRRNIENQRYADNPEPALNRARKRYEENPEECRAAVRAYRRNNPEKAKAAVALAEARNPQRILRKRGIREDRIAGMHITTVVRDEIIKRDGLWRYLCELPVARMDVHIDHLDPVSRGGSVAYDNMVVTHSKCNLSKGNKTYDEFMHYIIKIKNERYVGKLPR